jgi:hypothetical protein
MEPNRSGPVEDFHISSVELLTPPGVNPIAVKYISSSSVFSL